MRALAAAVFAVIALAAPAAAQSDAMTARDQEIAATDRQLDEIRSRVEADAADDIRDVEARLRELLHDSRGRLPPVSRALDSASQSLGQLGPAPAESEPPESEPLAARRADLRAQVSVLQGQRTRVLSNIDEAVALLAELSSRRLALLYRGLLERGPALVAPSLWAEAADSVATLSSKMSRFFAQWSAAKSKGAGVAASLLMLAAAFVASILLVGPVHRWMQRTFARRLEKTDPTPGRRVALAGVKMIARLVPGVVGGFAVIETSRAVGLLGAEGLGVARAIWLALVAFLLVEGFTSGLFAPAAPAWRIAAVDAEKGRRASTLLLAIVAIFGLKSIFAAIAEAAGASAGLATVLDGVSAVIIGGLLIALCRRSLWTHAEPAAKDASRASADAGDDNGAAGNHWQIVRRTGRVLGFVIIGAAAAGFIPLADFAASRLYFFALILAIAWFARAALKEMGAWAERRLRGGVSKDRDDDDKQIARFWIGAGIDFMLLLALAPMLLILVGLGWQSVRDMVVRAFLGFRIGGAVISLADVFVALGVFFVILALTRLLQGGLQRGPFAHSRIDPGVQNSLTTLLGYVGLLIAVVAGVTALGFDLSNLALIAGALSVGIGFGLQSIVNNFVSGLILLFERPIKVGDWIITASGEGTVKKISVRSTEIETFDRSSIIIPNSELISQSVTNWTHKNKIGRVIVPVGVSYSADPEKVKEVLLKCARDHPLIVNYPEPFVVWQDFGASSLDFEVRAYLRDITNGLTVRTELRFAIFKALKEAGVEIPFPQRDLHIRSMPAGEAPKPVAREPAKAEESAKAGKPAEFAEDD